ncbi:MAG: SprT family zinc-dependent metalloprotease [Candidatus Micrarchaeaceae archaeon]
MVECVEIYGRKFEVVLLRKAGTTATATVYGNLIKIRIPSFLKEPESNRIFLELKQKIIMKLEKNPYALEAQEEPEFYNGQSLSVLGKKLTIRIANTSRKSSTASICGNEILLSLSCCASEQERKRQVRRLCRRAISAAVHQELAERVKRLNSKTFNVELSKISVTYSRTRWGSCNTRQKRISLNFLLLFAPDPILDYVVLHELAHLKEHNHSRAFWMLVSAAMPDYEQAKRWLSENGGRLASHIRIS